jgi:hypothetical protein
VRVLILIFCSNAIVVLTSGECGYGTLKSNISYCAVTSSPMFLRMMNSQGSTNRWEALPPNNWAPNLAILPKPKAGLIKGVPLQPCQPLTSTFCLRTPNPRSQLMEKDSAAVSAVTLPPHAVVLHFLRFGLFGVD